MHLPEIIGKYSYFWTNIFHFENVGNGRICILFLWTKSKVLFSTGESCSFLIAALVIVFHLGCFLIRFRFIVLNERQAEWILSRSRWRGFPRFWGRFWYSCWSSHSLFSGRKMAFPFLDVYLFINNRQRICVEIVGTTWMITQCFWIFLSGGSGVE